MARQGLEIPSQMVSLVIDVKIRVKKYCYVTGALFTYPQLVLLIITVNARIFRLMPL
jgi:hypothetical protein